MTRTTDLSPQDAAAALRGLESIETRLSLKAGAISWMLFGLAGAGIFVTYGTIGPWFDDIGMPWLYALPWAPWILGATIGVNALWRMMNVTFDRPEDAGSRYGWVRSLFGTGAFFVVAVAAYLVLDVAFGIHVSTHVLMLFVVGLFTAGLALYQGKAYCAPSLAKPFVIAGVALIAVAFALGVADLSDRAAALVAAAADLTAYFAAAAYVYHRG